MLYFSMCADAYLRHSAHPCHSKQIHLSMLLALIASSLASFLDFFPFFPQDAGDGDGNAEADSID